MNERKREMEEGARRLEEHAAECDDCRISVPPLASLASSLSSYSMPLDVAAMSRRVLAALRPELARLASIWFWRRLGLVTLAALAPLPLIIAFDVYVLQIVYGWALTVLPAVVATYLVVSYATTQLFLIGATYAAIPLVLARDAWNRGVVPAEVAS